MTGFAIIFVLLALLLRYLWRREPRSMLNAGVFGLLLGTGYLLVLESASSADDSGRAAASVGILVFIGLPLLYLIGSTLLIWNGRTMVKNEGLSLSHLLAPLVGAIPILIGFAVIGLFAIQRIFVSDTTLAIGGILLALVVALYGYVLWIAYFTIPYAAFYTWIPKNPAADFIIVHGAGLIDGRVTPLLASRLDKAIEVFEAGGQNATFITSGGQGEDEPVAEAVAMADYLLDKKIPAELIVPEDQSRTTYENMAFSKEIIERRSDNPGSVLFVTSNYHVFRTALIARKVGLDAQGVGSPTAKYYLPSAIIREFVAITVMYKWWHLLPIIAIGGAFLLILILGSI